MPPASQELFSRPRSPTGNLLTVSGSNLRRVVLFLRLSSTGREQLRHQIPWWVSSYATLTSPGTALAPLQNANGNVNLAPSRLKLPPLGANLMHVATAYWPPQPPIESLSFLFSTESDEPSNQAWAFGYPDSTPHDYSGFWVMPFGSGPMMQRVDEYDEPNAERIAARLEKDPELAKKVSQLVEEREAHELARTFEKYPDVHAEVRRMLRQHTQRQRGI